MPDSSLSRLAFGSEVVYSLLMIPQVVPRMGNMAYCNHPLGPVPDCTERLAKVLLRGQARRRFIILAEQLTELFSEFESQLEASYPDAGQWGIHPFRVIGLLLLQAMEGLSDRQATEMVVLNVGWKLVLRLPMDHEGWNDSILSKARDRFLETQVLMELFDAFLASAKDKGYLNVIKQRVDATHIEACVRSLNRVELVLETVRNAIEALTEEDVNFVRSIRRENWLKRYYLDRPFNYRLPKSDSERTKMAEAAGDDGFHILKSIEQAPKDKRNAFENLQAIETLRKVLEEQFSSEDRGKPKFKESKELKPSGIRIASPYEPEARNACKGETNWTGYKAHLTETCVKGFPNLITQVETTVGTENDSETLPKITESLSLRNLKPEKLFTDSGYVNVDLLSRLKSELGIDVMARLANGHSWQSQQGKGFDQSSFSINWSKRQVTCPAQATSVQWKNTNDGGSNVHFAKEQCSSCPFKTDCTKGEYRVLHLKSESVWRHMQAMKERQQTQEFRDECKIRAGVEGTQSEFAKVVGRQSTVRGLAKVHQKNVLAAIAMNFKRMTDWMNGKGHNETRVGKYQTAMAAA